MAFNLVHLRTFYHVARAKSFSAAAEILHLSQPAVSRQIQSFERELDVTLFAVRGRRVELSEAGRLLFHYAEQVLSLADEAESMLTSLKDLEHGEVRISSSSTPGNYLLPEPIARFRQRHPGLAITLRSANSHLVFEHVGSGESELGFAGCSPSYTGFFVETLFEDELLLVASPQHPLARKGALTSKDLADQILVTREEGSGTQRAVDEHLTELGVTPVETLVMNHPEAIKRVVAAGVGVAFLPRITLSCELDGGLLTVIHAPCCRIRRPLLMISAQNRRLSPGALAFRAFLHRHYRSL